MVIMDLSGVHLRELARVIDAVRCHDDMFSAMQTLDGRLWTIGTHGPTAGSALFVFDFDEGCVFLQVTGNVP